jgi:hypothetical protein
MVNTMSKTGQKQKGMTGISIAVLLVLFGFIALIGLKLFPVYMESFKVNSALDSLEKEAGVAKKPSGAVVTLLMKRLDIDDVESVTRQEISIERSTTGMTVYVDYEVEKHLFSNISLLVVFEKSAEIPK